MNRFRFIRVRDVHSPNRANPNDAGLDFYVPSDLTSKDIDQASPDNKSSIDYYHYEQGYIEKFRLLPGRRVLIPSGIKGLLEPPASMLMAANKSGIATKKGLIFTAEIVDSPYVGEIHIGVYNTNRNTPVIIEAGAKLVQFIHVPIFVTEPEEVGYQEFYSESQMWGSRGNKGFGSSDNK